MHRITLVYCLFLLFHTAQGSLEDENSIFISKSEVDISSGDKSSANYSECVEIVPLWIRKIRIKSGLHPCIATIAPPKRRKELAWNWENWKNQLLPTPATYTSSERQPNAAKWQFVPYTTTPTPSLGYYPWIVTKPPPIAPISSTIQPRVTWAPSEIYPFLSHYRGNVPRVQSGRVVAAHTTPDSLFPEIRSGQLIQPTFAPPQRPHFPTAAPVAQLSQQQHSVIHPNFYQTHQHATLAVPRTTPTPRPWWYPPKGWSTPAKPKLTIPAHHPKVTQPPNPTISEQERHYKLQMALYNQQKAAWWKQQIKEGNNNGIANPVTPSAIALLNSQGISSHNKAAIQSNWHAVGGVYAYTTPTLPALWSSPRGNVWHGKQLQTTPGPSWAIPAITPLPQMNQNYPRNPQVPLPHQNGATFPHYPPIWHSAPQGSVDNVKNTNNFHHPEPSGTAAALAWQPQPQHHTIQPSQMVGPAAARVSQTIPSQVNQLPYTTAGFQVPPWYPSNPNAKGLFHSPWLHPNKNPVNPPVAPSNLPPPAGIDSPPFGQQVNHNTLYRQKLGGLWKIPPWLGTRKTPRTIKKKQ